MAKAPGSKQPVIALLGGGQLGRMFLENALRYDVEIHVLDPDPNCSCAQLASVFVQGRFDDRDTVLRFAAAADVVGIEIEHVSVEAMEALKAVGKSVIPDPSVLRTIKDKGLQKQFYRDHGIATLDFALIGDKAEIVQHAALLPGFLKSRAGGYDGKGVMPMNSLADADTAFDGPCVLEKRAEIAMELGVLVVRSAKGAHVVYDPVEMVFDPRFNLVDHLRAPARIDAALAKKAKDLALRVADAFAEPGLYAVELFLTKNGELLVNETAPRAHNSGHHTIEACASSQFDQLLRLYMGWPMGDVALRGKAAMINLVGEGGAGPVEVKGLDDVLHVPGTFLHLYGKKETRTGRKMGHVTVVAASDAELDQAIAVTKVHCRVVPVDGASLSAARPATKTN
ncbi:MAG: 5-(carboxyamino)imidazole ribonucleotide synthase [Flavobacteriales bacterium]|nr:5-(carboxyamino)imidazole ribonucleotide synthase [Flavobacteriales bacterium]